MQAVRILPQALLLTLAVAGRNGFLFPGVNGGRSLMKGVAYKSREPVGTIPWWADAALEDAITNWVADCNPVGGYPRPTIFDVVDQVYPKVVQVLEESLETLEPTQ